MKYFSINNVKFNYPTTEVSIIDYCENIGINIPHFCYHKGLSIAGNCRMCLVELKGSPKPLISCAMTLNSNMEIYTDSPLVKKVRENVLEFLLLNHPLDCPVCDQGGECDLQDQSFVFGTDKTRFYNFKRVVTNKNLGPIVKTVMTRCIHCTRCVRFASEIAGIEDLGMFGRGVNSEIGTYVTKIFNSELSGNVIDICPVGALTSKPYPFTARSWELKNISSIDLSDNFCTDIKIYTKSNKIIRILPDYCKTNYSTDWISDKTRFVFDGMFSPERVSETFVHVGKSIRVKSWKNLLNNVLCNLYFQDHLNNHCFEEAGITIVLGDDLDFDVLSLLILLSKKYSFVKIRQTNSVNYGNDFESNFLINSVKDFSEMSRSKLCILVNTNPRYEGYTFNLKLRRRYLKGDFEILSLGSAIDLTYPVLNIGSGISVLKSVVEGNHPLCQKLKISKYPFLVIGTDTLKRNDSSGFRSMLLYFKTYLSSSNSDWNSLNFLNNTVSSSTMASLNSFKNLDIKDFVANDSFYFINIDFKTALFRKLIQLKLLQFYKTNSVSSFKFVINQNSVFTETSLEKLQENTNASMLFNFPNKVFFEDSGVYLNNEGIFKKKVKVIPSILNSKSNWNILRSVFNLLQNINLINNNIKLTNKILGISLINRSTFRKFVNFQFIAAQNLSGFHYYSLNNCLSHSSCGSPSNLYKYSKIKINLTKSKLWLEDYYLGGKDIPSKFSTVMIKCSKELRANSLNFNFFL